MRAPRGSQCPRGCAIRLKPNAIGDRTPGLKYNEDGSLDVYIQKDSPGADKESNWLPAPEGDFRPVLRMYQPRSEALDGTFVLPAIRRVG